MKKNLILMSALFAGSMIVGYSNSSNVAHCSNCFGETTSVVQQDYNFNYVDRSFHKTTYPEFSTPGLEWPTLSQFRQDHCLAHSDVLSLITDTCAPTLYDEIEQISEESYMMGFTYGKAEKKCPKQTASTISEEDQEIVRRYKERGEKVKQLQEKLRATSDFNVLKSFFLIGKIIKVRFFDL